MNKERIDVLLVEKGFFESREKAKASIMAGVVYANEQKIDKAGEEVSIDAKLEVRENICEEQVENNVVPQAKSNFNTEKISENKPSDFEKSSEEKQEPELEHIKTQQEEMDEIERESQRIIQEYKAEMEAEKDKDGKN